VPTDPGVEFDEMVDEILEEVRKRRGGKPLPNPAEVRRQIEKKLSEKSHETREEAAKAK
jgi:lysophospholipid acyltransferase